MSDAIKLNLFSRKDDPTLWEHAEKFVGEPGKVYVFAHGSPDSISDDRRGKENSIKLSSLGLAKLLEAAGATPSDKVMLHSCSTGQDPHSIGRELTHYFIEVEAPTRILYDASSANEAEFRHLSSISGRGAPGVFSAESTEMTTALKGADYGRMKQFHAADYALSMTRPDLVDTPASELPNGKPRTYMDKENGITHYNHTWAERDLGDERPISDSIHGAERWRLIRPSEVSIMAKEYANAISMHSEEARTQAEHKYPELKMAFSYHDKMMAHAANVSNPDIVEKSINQHIAQNILKGKFTAFLNTEQHVAQH